MPGCLAISGVKATRYSGSGKARGCMPSTQAGRLTMRSCGTKTFSMATLVLPLPRMPVEIPVVSSFTSLIGTSAIPGAAGLPSLLKVGTPSRSHCA